MTVDAVSTAGPWCCVDQQTGTPEQVRADTDIREQQSEIDTHCLISPDLYGPHTAQTLPSSEYFYEGKADVVYLQVTLCDPHLSA